MDADLKANEVLWLVLLVNKKTLETTLKYYAVDHGVDLKRRTDLKRQIIQQNPNHRILAIKPAQDRELVA